MMSVIVDVSDCAFPLLYFLLYRLPAHSKCLRITSRPCGLMARKTSDDSHQVSERALEPGSGLGFCRRAGDGNRTRTISEWRPVGCTKCLRMLSAAIATWLATVCFQAGNAKLAEIV